MKPEHAEITQEIKTLIDNRICGDEDITKEEAAEMMHDIAAYCDAYADEIEPS